MSIKPIYNLKIIFTRKVKILKTEINLLKQRREDACLSSAERLFRICAPL